MCGIRVITLSLLLASDVTCPIEAAEKENPLVRTAHYLEDWAQPAGRAEQRPAEKRLIEMPRARKENALVSAAAYLQGWARPAPSQEKKIPVRVPAVQVKTRAKPIAEKPDWSIIVYSEAKASAVRQFFAATIPENAELLIESPAGDTAGNSRVISRPAGYSEKMLQNSGASFPGRFTSFLLWAKEQARGKYRLLVINIPAPADIPAMARSLSRAALDSTFSADIVLLNISGLDDVTVLRELEGMGKYLIIPQWTMPASGIPADRLFSMVREPTISPFEFARVFPRTYVEEYAHDGSMAAAEGGYRIVGLMAIDTAKLAASKEAAKNDPVSAGDDGAFTITLAPDKVRSFEARIEACPYGKSEEVMSDERQYWIGSNQGSGGASGFVFDLKDIGEGEGLRREFIVKGDVTAPTTFRPWLPGAQYVILTTVDGEGRSAIRHYTRDKDYCSTESFPLTSFMISEAHSQGASYYGGIKLKQQAE